MKVNNACDGMVLVHISTQHYVRKNTGMCIIKILVGRACVYIKKTDNVSMLEQESEGLPGVGESPGRPLQLLHYV